ncbi:hypothetical protein PRZ48_008248 [Zasmidium cellare]|uniref:Uncharacterized protein n=1 Tax=Zasmidium cellare TaxID=395010 RepID=A0ABR0EF09_ZASCE|nr:hypothetical protein PRZ48_008248 [Zasmidium cellare]
MPTFSNDKISIPHLFNQKRPTYSPNMSLTKLTKATALLSLLSTALADVITPLPVSGTDMTDGKFSEVLEKYMPKQARADGFDARH